MRHRIATTGALAGALLALCVPAAVAHVTLQPEEAPAGGFARLDVRVPTERDNASTTKVRVQFPPGFLFISTEPEPGWRIQVKKERLAKPVEVFGEQIREQVDEVVLTAGSGAAIKPGEFRDFGLSLRMPEKPGSSVTFKALQTYSNGEVVRWIGPPDAEEPAPQVRITAAEEEGGAATEDDAEQDAGTPAAAADDDGEDDDEPSMGLVIAALVLGGLGLLAGLAGLSAARRTRQT